MRFGSISVPTFKKRLRVIVDLLKRRIADELDGEKYALVFDGFTDAAEHNLGVFIASPKALRFVAFSPFEDDASMTTADHIDFLDNRIRPFLHAVEGEDDTTGDDESGQLTALIPTATEHGKLMSMLTDMEQMHVVTKALQSDSKNVADVRYLFDELVSSFPVMAARLAPNADIVESVSFETIKISRDKSDESDSEDDLNDI
ncbi:hypothetical protein ATCC90586_009350 [Pythium insidiosum]|nr:hypothetical protein ATCC90586_009350 [Pythium insidiosum]